MGNHETGPLEQADPSRTRRILHNARIFVGELAETARETMRGYSVNPTAIARSVIDEHLQRNALEQLEKELQEYHGQGRQEAIGIANILRNRLHLPPMQTSDVVKPGEKVIDGNGNPVDPNS